MQTIAVAGATGNLGHRIVKAAKARGAQVVALVRPESNADKVAALGVEGHASVPTGTTCVISAVQGVADVIVEAQLQWLEQARAVGARFIPSDFSTDYRELAAGENRNFDLRRAFHEAAGEKDLTAIFNGAFAEVLAYGGMIDRKQKRVTYWHDADWKMDFTTMDDTAAFTAAAALDADAPAALRCASFQVTARQLADKLGFELVNLGTLEELVAKNHADRAAHPEGETEVFPAWQRGQYVQSMMTTHHASLDNARYDITWTSVDAFLAAALR